MANIKTILIVGGSGFIGSALANYLADRNIQCIIPVRRRSRAGHLILLPNVRVVQTDVFDPVALNNLMPGVDAVINLAGILHSPSGKPFGSAFQNVHEKLPQRLSLAARGHGVSRFIHISALGADSEGSSEYLRSKAAGEKAVQSLGKDVPWFILRPSIVFGRHDRFINLFAELSKYPVIPVGRTNSRMQPVYVGDICQVIDKCLFAAETNQILPLAGPEIYTLRDIINYSAAQVGHNTRVLGLPDAAALLLANLMRILPQPPLSPDNIRSLRTDSVSDKPLPFGITATSMRSVVPTYLGLEAKAIRYDEYRRSN